MSDDDARSGGAAEDRAPDADLDLGEETRRVVSAVQDWMRRAVPAEQTGPDDHSTSADGRHGAADGEHGAPDNRHVCADCQWCPICQIAGVLRGERPDVAEKITEAGVAIAGALRAVVEAAVARTPDPRPAPRTPSTPGSAGAATGPTGPTRRPRPSPVQRSDLQGGAGA